MNAERFNWLIARLYRSKAEAGLALKVSTRSIIRYCQGEYDIPDAIAVKLEQLYKEHKARKG